MKITIINKANSTSKQLAPCNIFLDGSPLAPKK